MWNKFLIEWNGISLFHDLHISPTPDIELFTDAAATVGHGGYYQDHQVPSPGATCSTTPTPVPPQLASNVALNAHLNRLWSAVVSKGTQTAYSTGMTCYIKFLLTCGLFQTMFYHRLPPVNEVYLQYFIAHCYGVLQLKHVTVKTYLAGLRFFYLQRGITTIFDHRGSGALNRLQSIMRGYKKLQAPTPRKRLPITYTVLARIMCTLRAGVLGLLNDLVMECMCLTAFFGFLRCGEITCGARFDPSANICLSDIKFDFAKRKCTILLKASKTDPFRVGVPIILFSNSRLCPFSSLRKLFYTRTLQQASSEDALFVDAQHQPITRALFLSWLSRVLTRAGFNSNEYSGHSFRIGAATTAASARVEDHLIKTMGRWNSDCFQRCIRTSEETLLHAQRLLCGP
ncbi:uncharacterized protein [Haliotis cracherodii]|uniref:uncharacterized protein n=1 Tax=Haliotis cracherodii TaxID=6455 RepID=UPI0039E765CE